MKSLKTQATRGIKWSSLQAVIVGLLGILTLFIKSKFLLPEDFAHLSIILIVIGLFQVLETFGISQGIIQKDTIKKEEISSILFFNIFISLFFAIGVFFCSNLLAIFFSMPRLENYLEIVSIIVLISGPSLLFSAFLEKEMYFKQISFINMLRNSITFLLIFAFLFFELGVKGVIYAHILSTSFTSFAVIYFCRKLKLVHVIWHFSFSSLKPFLKFGAFVSSKQLLTFVTHRLDEILIGHFLDPNILGVYHFGKNMLEKIRSLMTNSFSKVLFPVFSKLKHDILKLTSSYLQASKFLALATFPVFIGIAITAHLFVPIVFGAEWVDSVIVFRVFSVSMIFLLLTANVATSLLFSLNKPDMVLYIDLITSLLYFITLFLFANKGLIFVLTIYSGFVILKTIVFQFYSIKQLNSNLLNYLHVLINPAMISILMGISVLLFQKYFAPIMGEIYLLISSILLGVVSYILINVLFFRSTIIELKNALKI